MTNAVADQCPMSQAAEADTGRTPYVAYVGADTMADLIQPRTDEPLEVTFIVATQIMELHFQLLRHEWRLAIARLDADDLKAALAAMARATLAQDSVIRSWELLSTMSPVQYNRFRDALGSASGFQSFSYRELEFLLGAKDERMLRPHAGMTVHPQLQQAFDAPSLYDAALALLTRRGILQHDVVEAWAAVYHGDDDELAQLAEALTATAERHSTWRFVHYTAVRRILGDKPGTGGSAGVAWLKRSVDAPVFSELWEVRGAL